MRTLASLVLGAGLVLSSASDLHADLCPSEQPVAGKSAFAIFFLQWPGSGSGGVNCAKSQATINAVDSVWVHYDNQSDRWNGASTTDLVAGKSLFPAYYGLLYMEAHLYSRGVIMVNTHGSDVNGAPIFEYYDTGDKDRPKNYFTFLWA